MPDDAFFSPDGKDIIATEEDYSVISVIDIARHKIVYRYGTPGVPGSGNNHAANPDDVVSWEQVKAEALARFER